MTSMPMQGSLYATWWRRRCEGARPQAHQERDGNDVPDALLLIVPLVVRGDEDILLLPIWGEFVVEVRVATAAMTSVCDELG